MPFEIVVKIYTQLPTVELALLFYRVWLSVTGVATGTPSSTYAVPGDITIRTGLPFNSNAMAENTYI